MKSMPRVDDSRKRKAEGGASYGKKSKTDPLVLVALLFVHFRVNFTVNVTGLQNHDIFTGIAIF